MPSSRRLITSTTLSSSAASVTFSGIPATYTDLVLRCSIRTSVAGVVAVDPSMTFNSDSSSIYSNTYIQGNGASASSGRSSGASEIGFRYGANDTGSTSNTFTSVEFYIPNYTSTSNKTFSTIIATETNATTAYINNIAQLYRNTSAISSFTINIGAGAYNISAGSSFFLYGLFNS